MRDAPSPADLVNGDSSLDVIRRGYFHLTPEAKGVRHAVSKTMPDAPERRKALKQAGRELPL